MKQKDLLLSVFAAYLTAFFGWLTLVNSSLIEKIPYPIVVLFVILPTVAVMGMAIAKKLSEKIKILWQLAKFAFVGVVNTAMDFGIYSVLIGITHSTSGVPLVMVNIVSFSTAVINSYFWNKEWVFDASKKSRKFITFVAVTLIGLSLNTVVVYALTKYVPPVGGFTPEHWALVAKVFATGVSMVWNFAGYKLIVFKK